MGGGLASSQVTSRESRYTYLVNVNPLTWQHEFEAALQYLAIDRSSAQETLLRSKKHYCVLVLNLEAQAAINQQVFAATTC
jgi:hypothetical protein